MLPSPILRAFPAVLLLFLIGCSDASVDAGADMDATGDWGGTYDMTVGTQRGFSMSLQHFADDVTGTYREAEPLSNGRTRVTQGSLQGQSDASRIQVKLSDGRTCTLTVRRSEMTGPCTSERRPSLTLGTLSLSRR